MEKTLSDLTLQELMQLNITDARNRFGISDKEFQKILVPFNNPEMKKIKNDLSSFLFEREFYTKYIMFKGKGGTGKSTFLYFFFEENKSKCNYDIINFNDYKSETGDEKLVRDNIRGKIVNELAQEIEVYKKEIDFFCKHIESNNRLNQCFGGIYVSPQEKTKNFKGLLTALANHEIYENNYKTNLEAEIQLLFDKTYKLGSKRKYFFTIRDVITMYLILKTICLISKSRKEKLIFCLDNLDAFSQTYLASDFLDSILNIDTHLSELFKTIFNYTFEKKAHFIMSFRDVNLNLLKSIGIGIETVGRINGKYRSLDFDNEEATDDIINKRLDTDTKDIPGESTIKRKKIIKAIIRQEDEHSRNKMIPYLFNKNNRDIMKTLEIITNKTYPYSLNLTETEYNHISDNYIEGARGILLLSFLKHFNTENTIFFFEKLLYEFNKNLQVDSCCPFRMIMTVLTNMCRIEKNGKTTFDRKFTLLALCKEIEKNKLYIKKEELFNCIEEFHVPTNDYSLLLFELEKSEFGIKIDIKDLKQEKSKVSSYVRKYFNGKSKSSDVETFLNQYNVIINTAIISCIQHVYIHYEYFNFCKNHDTGEIISLFQSFDYPHMPRPNDKLYIFESQIPQIFSFIKDQILGMDNYFEEQFCLKQRNKINPNINLFLKSSLTYKKTFYSTRIINHHINYIDKFRKHLFNKKNKEKLDRNYSVGLSAKDSTMIQDFLIDQIEKYVDLFTYIDVQKHRQREIIDYSKQPIFDQLIAKIKNARESNNRGEFELISFNNEID